MNYASQVRDMLLHLSQHENRLQENLNDLLAALGTGIARAMALIDNHDDMHRVLDAYLLGVAAESCISHSDFQKARGKDPACEENEIDEEVVDYETFLRDIFKPEKTND